MTKETNKGATNIALAAVITSFPVRCVEKGAPTAPPRVRATRAVSKIIAPPAAAVTEEMPGWAAVDPVYVRPTNRNPVGGRSV